MSYLLDTNTWIALVQRRNPDVLAELKRRPADEILLCSVVLGELWYGAERSDESRRLANYSLVNELQAQYHSVPFDDGAAREYAAIRASLASGGNPIGPNDTMIAAIARHRNATLVTNNTAEYSRVPRLIVEDWQSPQDS